MRKSSIGLMVLAEFIFIGKVYAGNFAGQWKLFVNSSGVELKKKEVSIGLKISEAGAFYNVEVETPEIPAYVRNNTGLDEVSKESEQQILILNLEMIKNDYTGKYTLSDDERSIEHLNGTVSFKYKKNGDMLCTSKLGCFIHGKANLGTLPDDKKSEIIRVSEAIKVISAIKSSQERYLAGHQIYADESDKLDIDYAEMEANKFYTFSIVTSGCGTDPCYVLTATRHAGSVPVAVRYGLYSLNVIVPGHMVARVSRCPGGVSNCKELLDNKDTLVTNQRESSGSDVENTIDPSLVNHPAALNYRDSETKKAHVRYSFGIFPGVQYDAAWSALIADISKNASYKIRVQDKKAGRIEVDPGNSEAAFSFKLTTLKNKSNVKQSRIRIDIWLSTWAGTQKAALIKEFARLMDIVRQAGANEGDDSADNIIGTWRGMASEAGAPPYELIVQINSPSAGSTSIPSQNCAGSLSGGPNGAKLFEFSESISSGRCVNSTDTAQLTDADTMLFSQKVLLNGKTCYLTTTLKKDAR